MDSITLKNKIFKKISGLLGTYQLKSVVPAIWIGLPDPKTVVKGLECIIAEFPVNSSHGNQIINERWNITLTQYPGLDTIAQASDILRSLLRPCEVSFVQKPANAASVADLPFLPQTIIVYYCKELKIVR